MQTVGVPTEVKTAHTREGEYVQENKETRTANAQ